MRSKIRNAFIRVSSSNDTAEGLITYTSTDIENNLNDWLTSANFTYYFIEHPADDEINQTHWHILLRFPSPTQFETIKNRFPFGDIEPARNSKNCIQYMVHLNDQSKKQYSWDDIKTNDKNTDWYKVQSGDTSEVLLQGVMEKIMSGEIRQYNQVEKISPDLWSKYRTRITNLFDYYTEKICMDKNRSIDTVYLSGSTGLGKTTFAKRYCELRGLSYCISSASNDPLQDYQGQDVLILDDFRGDARHGDKSRSFEFHDFLKLLDPHTRSSGKSRYRNKAFIGNLIIITSTRPLYDLYFDLGAEDKQQLYRRISHQYQFTLDKIFIYGYSSVYKRYQPVGHIPNVIKFPKPSDSSLGLDFSAFGVQLVPCDLPSEDADVAEPSSCLPSLTEALERRHHANNRSQCLIVEGGRN